MKNLKIGDKCYITEESRIALGLTDEKILYSIKDFLKENVEYKIVLTTKEFGDDWVEFFKEDEIIPVES